MSYIEPIQCKAPACPNTAQYRWAVGNGIFIELCRFHQLAIEAKP